MKIIRITTFLDFGGVEKQLELYSKRFLDKHDDDLTIVALGYGGRVAEEIRKLGAEVIILDQPVKIPNLKLIIELFKLFNDKKPDVVHCAAAEANFHGLIAAKLARVPLKIGEEIGFPNHNRVWRYIFKFTYLCANIVICISNSVADKIVSFEEVSRSKIRVVYNPVEIESPQEGVFDLPKQDNFTFITVCRLVPVKNLETLLFAFAQLVIKLDGGNFFLQIVGDGPHKQVLIDLCETLKISDKVSFIGYRSSVVPYLIHSDAFVQPSFSEGFSIALVEAMLCGLPSIVTEVGGPSEIIREGITGFLIDPYDIQKLCQVMEYVFEMPQHERSTMGVKAKKEALERFSVDKYIEELWKVYNIG